MPNSQWPFTPPKKILLATDLSARSDRALDRATQLAQQWNAALVVVHALEDQTRAARSPTFEDLPSWRRPPDPAVAVEAQIRRDLRGAISDLRIVVTEGDPPDVILDIAQREQCDLIVIGAARDQVWAEWCSAARSSIWSGARRYRCSWSRQGPQAPIVTF